MAADTAYTADDPAAKPPAMTSRHPSSLDKFLARVCVNCPVCRHARRRQAGPAFRLVKQVETKVCPFCRAYERVYGKKAHL